MGTDLHMVVEAMDRNYETGRDEWQCVIGREGSYCERDYILFSVLAGVRQEDVEPIALPRGLPEDLSQAARKELEDTADHSHSWLTLAEVLAYPWDRSFEYTAVADALNCARIFAGYEPVSWCQGISGASIKRVSTEEMRDLVKAHPFNKYELGGTCRDLRDRKAIRHEPHPLDGYWADVSWHRTPRRACEDFLAWLKALETTRIRYTDRDRVRLVFGFDS